MIFIDMKGFNHQTIGSSWESKQQKWLAVPITGRAIFLGKVSPKANNNKKLSLGLVSQEIIS